MSALRTMSMQNLTRTREIISSHGANNGIASLQNILISSGFSQSLRNAFDDAQRVRCARCRTADARR
jgi:hypothetical protein